MVMVLVTSVICRSLPECFLALGQPCLILPTRLVKDWNYPYTPQEAVYPVPYLKEFKYWVPVRRVDNAYGDRNLVCSCPSVESYKNIVA